jgi:hypothetical protein
VRPPLGPRPKPTVQRAALLKLAGYRDNALRRDECGDWQIVGKLGGAARRAGESRSLRSSEAIRRLIELDLAKGRAKT